MHCHFKESSLCIVLDCCMLYLLDLEINANVMPVIFMYNVIFKYNYNHEYVIRMNELYDYSYNY